MTEGEVEIPSYMANRDNLDPFLDTVKAGFTKKQSLEALDGLDRLIRLMDDILGQPP